MRAIILGALLAACSVDEKLAIDPDGGVDGAGTIDAPLPSEGTPETTITSGPTEFTRAGLAVFEFQADLANATFACSVDGETPVACTSPFSRSLGDGPHAFAVRASSQSGETDDTPAEHLWSIDTVPPETTLTTAPPAADNSTVVRFEFTSAEPNVSFECSLDSGAYLACESGADTGPVSDGAHSFAVRAVDRAGNLDASPAVHAWSVNTSTPDTQILSAPDGATAQTSATITFLSPDAGGGATFECALDAAAFAACTSPRMLTNLANGEHTFAVRVRDAVGNVDPTPATRTWVVDRTPPETTITAGPTGTQNVASASFSFTSSEAGATFACKLDAGAEEACTSPASYPNLVQGAHTFSVRATDAAGTADASPALRGWTVDTLAPELLITNGPAPGGTVGPRVVVAFTVDEGTTTCSIDGAAAAPCTSPLGASLAPGPHSITIRAVDAVENTAMATRMFTVACAAPSASGAIGLLRFDTDDQVQPTAVAGGPTAFLGDTEMDEPIDPKQENMGRYGKALKFDMMKRVTWPVALGAQAALALDLWAKPKDAMTAELVQSGDGAVALTMAAMGMQVRFTATVNDRTVTSAPVPRDQWHHVVMSVDGAALRLWVDGVRTEVTTPSAAPDPVVDTLKIGAPYNGAIDELWLGTSTLATDDAALVNYCPD